MPNVQGDKEVAPKGEQVKSVRDENHLVRQEEEPEKVVDEATPIDQP